MTTAHPVAPLDLDDVRSTLRPIAEARTLPRPAYVDEAVAAWERRFLFEARWICVGRSDIVAARRQQAVTVGDTGVLLTRDDRGQLRGFANICRHRGHELLACGGSADRTTIRCPYHGWVYDLAGALRNAPRFDNLPPADVDDMALVAVGVAEWAGWTFVNVDGTAGALHDHLGALPALIADWQCERLLVGAEHHYELAANWKLAVENYHECYHCPLIHPELSRVSPPDSGVNIEDLPGPFVGGAMTLAGDAATMSLDGASRGVVLPGLDAHQRRTVLYLNVFPNLLISLHPDYVMTHLLTPTSATTTAVQCQWLFDPATVADPGFDASYAVDFWDLTNRQDWAAVESVQRGLDSELFRPGVFASQEDAVYHFATMVASAYLGGAPERRPAKPATAAADRVGANRSDTTTAVRRETGT